MEKGKYILFVCIENACRSQIAEGLFNSLTNKDRAISAGTMPSSINPMAIKVMKDKGIDITQNISKQLTPDLVKLAFKVVTMGCIDQCPYAPESKTIKWDIPDPKGQDEAYFISVRDTIESEIITLIKNNSLL